MVKKTPMKKCGALAFAIKSAKTKPKIKSTMTPKARKAKKK